MELEKLKARAYDILALREQLALELNQLNKKISEFILKENEEKIARDEIIKNMKENPANGSDNKEPDLEDQNVT